MTTLREYHPHRLVCLFGCGGNRSKYRRYEMGEVSGRLADLTIITSDNPRNEEPQAIIEDIKIGISKTQGKYVEIPDRKEAIRYAIEHGEPGDIIILAGKGHEDYQEIKGKKYPMDERVLIADILARQMRKREGMIFADMIVDISHEKLDRKLSVSCPARTGRADRRRHGGRNTVWKRKPYPQRLCDRPFGPPGL